MDAREIASGRSAHYIFYAVVVSVKVLKHSRQCGNAAVESAFIGIYTSELNAKALDLVGF